MASGPKESYPAALHPSESVDATTNAPTMSSSASGENDGAVMSLQAQPPPPSLRSLFQVPGYPQPRTKQCIHCRMASEICTGGRTCERCFLSGLRCETDDNAELQTLYIAQPRPRVIPPPPSADFPQYTYPVAPRPIPESGSFPCPADSRPLSPDRASETHVEYAATPISTPAPRYVAEAPPQEPPRSLSAGARLNPSTVSLSAFRYPRPSSFPISTPPSHGPPQSSTSPDHLTSPERLRSSSPGLPDVPISSYARSGSVSAPIYGSVPSTTTVSPVYQSPPAPAYIPQQQPIDSAARRMVPPSPFRMSGLSALSYACDIHSTQAGYTGMEPAPPPQYSTATPPPTSIYTETPIQPSPIVPPSGSLHPPMHIPVSPPRPPVYNTIHISPAQSTLSPPTSHGMSVGSSSSHGNWPTGSMPSYGGASSATSSSPYGTIGARGSPLYGTTGSGSSSLYGNTGPTSSAQYGAVGATSGPQYGSMGATSSSQYGNVGASSPQYGRMTATSSSQYRNINASSPQYGVMGATSASQYGSMSAPSSSQYGSMGATSASQYGSMGATSASQYGSMGATSGPQYGSMGATSSPPYRSTGTMPPAVYTDTPPSHSGIPSSSSYATGFAPSTSYATGNAPSSSLTTQGSGLPPWSYNGIGTSSSSSAYGGVGSSSSAYGGMGTSSSSGYGSMGTSASSSSGYGNSSSAYGNTGQGYGAMSGSSSLHGGAQMGYGPMGHPHRSPGSSAHPYMPYPGMGPRQMHLINPQSNSLRPYRHRRSRHRNPPDVHAGFFANDFDSFSMAEQALAAEFGARSPPPEYRLPGQVRYTYRLPPETACSRCRTTHTPSWRHGPCGPKTLCNACGLQWARRLRRLAVDFGYPA
ncbi:hypothetical protein C8Q76DRAFT_804092 [Earliella scabrosa]|nr:hypothetical protein C8Q76DRAFT_804092 [Earliella scabrosa]